MPGGGISDNNLEHILEQTGAPEFHASARTEKESQMVHRNQNCHMGKKSSEYSIVVTSVDKVKELVKIYEKVIKDKKTKAL